MARNRISHRVYQYIRPVLVLTGLIRIARQGLSLRCRHRLSRLFGLDGFEVSQTIIRQRPAEVLVDGINYITDLRAEIGIGESARLLYAALEQTSVPIRYIEVPLPIDQRGHPTPRKHSNNSRKTIYTVSLIHLNAPELHLAFESVGQRVLRNVYIIAFWYWELSAFPVHWFPMLHQVDEVWVASAYTRSVFGTQPYVPVTYIPLPIQATKGSKSRREFGLPEDRFVFMFSFSVTSSIARKNPFAVIDAFRQAFGNMTTTGPLLVIKVHHTGSIYGGNQLVPLFDAIKEAGGICFDENLSRQDMVDFLNTCDCFVSLHRAEGLGLHIAEAMALSKPVIATAYSGNMDYMDETTSYPVRYDLRPISPDDHQLFKGFEKVYTTAYEWAEPDIQHAAELMRYVFNHPNEARSLGASAEARIRSVFSIENTVEHVRQRLATIAEDQS